MLLEHEIPWARSFALLNAGSSMAAKIAMMAMTTNSSINVNPTVDRIDLHFLG